MTPISGVTETRERQSAAEPPAPDGQLGIVVVAASSDPVRAAVRLLGEVDLATADLMAEVLADQLARGRRFVRLDLSRLAFMDCSGLSVLVRAHQQYLRAGGTLVLTSVGPSTARLLAITALDRALLIADGPGRPRRTRPRTPVPMADAPRPGRSPTPGTP